MYVETIRVRDQIVMIKELTVGEIRAWFKRALNSRDDTDIVDLLIVDGIKLQDFIFMTDIEDTDQFTPRELQQIFEACKAANQDFFLMIKKVAKLAVDQP